MKSNFDGAFSHLMQSEGGYSNDPTDAGGETNLGVTKKAWAAYLGRPIKDGEMAALTPPVVKPFYKSEYWDKIRGDELPYGLDYLAFDFAVNAGVRQASLFLQRGVGAKADGVIGKETLSRIAQANARLLILGFTNQKELFYRDIVQRLPSQEKFLKGWLVRASTTEAKAMTMLA
jgi:lysozyme family protein